MRLSVYFSWLCLECGRLQRFMLKAFRSRLLWLYLGLCVVLAWCKVLQTAASFQTAMKTLGGLSSCYSGFVALTVIRQTRFWAILHEMRSLVQVLEEDERAAEKVWVARTRRTIVVFSCQTVTFGISTAVSVVLHFTISGDDTMVFLWPFVPYAGSWGVHVAKLVTGVGVHLIILTISFVVIALGCATSAATGLHHALAHGLLAAATPEVVGDVVALHQRLRRVTLDLTDFFADNLAHVMASAFFHSSAALIQVLASGVMTSTTFFQLLRVVVVFLQLSYLSQELSDSSLLLEDSAYRAATGSRTGLVEARALVLVMLAASRPPALSCKGLGRLSLASAAHAFRQLYSVVNVLKSRY